MGTILLTIFLLLVLAERNAFAAPCGPSYKRADNGSCISLSNIDVLQSMHWLTHPSITNCTSIQTAQDLSVCEEHLPLSIPNKCIIWSMISSTWCDHYGSLEFEIYWSKRGCAVTLFHLIADFETNICSTPPGPMEKYPEINVIRNVTWNGICYHCFYRLAETELTKLTQNNANATINVLKIQGRDGVDDDFDGVQYTILADLYLHLPVIFEKIEQIIFISSFNTRTLIDSVGRGHEHAWNMWATVQTLLHHSFAFFSFQSVVGPQRHLPKQFDDLLAQAELSTEFGSYRSSYIKLIDSLHTNKNVNGYHAWIPKQQQTKQLSARIPEYCQLPPASSPGDAKTKMQAWIDEELNVRCHQTQFGVACAKRGQRLYDAFVPCRQELMNLLAEDYAISKQWCDFDHHAASIPPLASVDKQAKRAFNKQPLKRNEKIRIAFFFTVYTDVQHVERLLERLYSVDHYYLLHVDPVGASVEFKQAMQAVILKYNHIANINSNNVFLTSEIPIVYGASTATMLLARAMAWFYHYATGWDYFVPLTGSDYPLVPLHRIEKILTYQNPPMPFLMAWTPGTSTHTFRLQKTYPIFEEHPLLVKSIQALSDERGKILGAIPMQFRSNNFGPPLFCNNQSSFYKLENRLNKSGLVYDTQWLFPRNNLGGRAVFMDSMHPQHSTPSFDNVWRVWKKSDPATTGVYDRASVEYIVTSTEGKKYYHFFKQMVLGSEEHYFISLLYNWPRTQRFVSTLNAQSTWNTWKLGMAEITSNGFQTHTNFLTLNEWDILHGFSLRGMMFARKFSAKKTAALLDRIDSEILLNSSTQAGLYWPGFYPVDTVTPGKQWIAAIRKVYSERISAIRAAAANGSNFIEQEVPMGLLVGNVSILASRGADTET